MAQTPSSNPDQDFIDELNKREEARKAQDNNQNTLSAINKAGIKNVEATNANTKSTAEGLKNVKGQVEVTNPDLAKTPDIDQVVNSIKEMNLTTFMHSNGYKDMAANMQNLAQEVQTLQQKFKDEGLTSLSSGFTGLITKIESVAKELNGTKITVDKGFAKTLADLQKSISAIDFKPQVNVAVPDTKVVSTPVNLKPVTDALSKVEQAVSSQKIPNNKVDLSPISQGLTAVQAAIENQRFPVPNYVLPFKDSTGKATQVQLDASGNVPITGGSGGGGTQYTQGGATVANPTGTAEIWFDGSGNPKSVTPSQPLPSNITDGTNAANVVAGDSGFNSLVVGGGRKEMASLSTAATSGNFLVAATDVSGYKSLGLQVSGTWTGTLIFEGSNDNTNWVTVNLSNSASTSGAGAAGGSTTGNALYMGTIYYRYFRVRVSITGTGTVQGTLELYTSPAGQTGTISTVNGTVGSNSATGSAVPANAFYIGISGSGAGLAGIVGANFSGDAYSGLGTVGVGNFVYNGTNWDRNRAATAASNTTGTGLLGVGALGYDGTNYQNLRLALPDTQTGSTLLGVNSFLYNGSTNDRPRANTTGVVIAAGATNSNAGVTTTTYNASKLLLAVNITAGAGTLTVAITGNTSSGYTYPILTSTALTGVADNTLRVFPGATPASNTVANDLVPRTFTVVTTVVGSVTYGIDYVLSV